MSATVAAALKKIAVAILTDKKARKVVLGIILGIIAGGILILISGVNPFDAYGAISDYARAREISERGRELMSAALDEYEALRTIPGRDRL